MSAAGDGELSGTLTGTGAYADASAVGDLSTVAVRVGEEFVDCSPEAAAKAVENSTPVEGRAEYDMDLARDTTVSGSYPIVLVSYHLYCPRYDSQEAPDRITVTD